MNEPKRFYSLRELAEQIGLPEHVCRYAVEACAIQPCAVIAKACGYAEEVGTWIGFRQRAIDLAAALRGLEREYNTGGVLGTGEAALREAEAQGSELLGTITETRRLLNRAQIERDVAYLALVRAGVASPGADTACPRNGQGGSKS